MSYKALSFDLFGTLVERFPVAEYHETLARMAELLALPQDAFPMAWHHYYPDQEAGRFPRLHDTITTVCQQCHMLPARGQIAAATQVLLEFMQHICRLRVDTLPTLAQLRARARKIAMISNCPPEVPVVWARSPAAPLIDRAIFSCVVKLRKPAAQIYWWAAHALQIPSGDCLFVGDGGAYELAGALHAGMDAVLLSIPGEEDPYNLSPEAREWRGPRVQSLAELLEVVAH
jgi:putative hydrolase of the HAD superfamily